MRSREEILQRINEGVKAASVRVSQKNAELINEGLIDPTKIKKNTFQSASSPEVAQQLLNPTPVQYQETANPVVDETLGDKYTDAVPMVGAGAGRFVSLVGTGMAALNEAGSYALNAVSGKPYSVDEALQNFADKTKLLGGPGRQLSNASQEQYSKETQQALAELGAIGNNSNLTETQGALETAKWATKNPGTVAVLLGENLIGSGLGTSAVGTVLPKAMGLGARVSVGTGIQEGAGYLDERANKTGTLNTDDVKMATAVGIVNGALEKYLGGTGKNFDMESNLLGLNNIGREAIKDLPAAMGREAVTEAGQEWVSNATGNAQDGNEITQGGGSASTLGAILGAGTTAVYATPHLAIEASKVTGQGTAASKNLATKAYDSVKKRYQNATDPYNYEVHSDPSSENYQPVRAFNESMGTIINATTAEEADLAAKQGQEVIVKATKHLNDLRDAYKAATTDEEKAAAKSAVEDFVKTHYNPLQQARQAMEGTGQAKSTNTNANKATGTDYVTQKIDQYVQANANTTATNTITPTTSTSTVQPTVNNKDSSSSINTSNNVTSTTNTTTTTKGNGKSLVQSIISRESGGNYGIANLSGSHQVAKGVDVTKMSIGQILGSNLNATGKYQTIKGTLKLATDSLGISRNTLYTPDVQERVGRWLMFEKQPALGAYIRGEHNDINKALHAASNEWQAVGSPLNGDRITIGRGKNVKRALTSYKEVAPSLQAARQAYAEAIKQGKSKAEAETYAINFGTTGDITVEANIGTDNSAIQTTNTTNTANDTLTQARNAVAQAISQRKSLAEIQELQKQVEELKAQTIAKGEAVEPTEEQKAQSKVVVVEAAQQVRANTLDATHIDQLEHAGVLTEEDANELRRMLDIKRVISSQRSPEQVDDAVYKGTKGATTAESDIGLNEYQTVLDDAIEKNDTATLDNYLSKLDNFAQNQTSKAAALEEAIAMNPSNAKPLYIAPDENNNWKVYEGRTSRDKSDPTFQAGAYQVWTVGDKAVETNNRIIQNATDVASLNDAYQSIVSNRQANGLLDNLSPKTPSSRLPKSKFANQTTSTVTSTTTPKKAFTDWNSKDFADSGITFTHTDPSQKADDDFHQMVKLAVNQGSKAGLSDNAIINQVSKVADAFGFKLEDKSIKNLTSLIGTVKSEAQASTTPKGSTPTGNISTVTAATTTTKTFNNTDGNVRTVSYNEAGSVKGKLAEDEVWVGHDYIKLDNGLTDLNYEADGKYRRGLSGFTYNNTDLKGKPDPRSLAMGMFGKHGMFGNPYRTNTKGKFAAKNHQEALNKYINFFKDLTTSGHPSRLQFLESLELLRSKKLVTDADSKQEAKFLDYILNAPEAQPLWDAMKDSNNTMKVADRKTKVDALQEWIASVEAEYSAPNDKGKVEITGFKQSDTTKAQFREQRKAERKGKSEVKTSTTAEATTPSSNVDVTPENQAVIDKAPEAAKAKEFMSKKALNDLVPNLVEYNPPKQETPATPTTVSPPSSIQAKGKVKSKDKAPDKMLSETELKSGITLEADETIDTLFEYLNEEMDLSKPNDLAKVLDKITLDGTVVISDDNTTEYEYLRNLILAMTNYMDKPKLVINPKATKASYNPETNTIEVAISDSMFGDIAAIVLKQATLDIADDIDSYTENLASEVSVDNAEYPTVMTDSDVNSIEEIKAIHSKLTKAKKALNRDLLSKNLDDLNLDSETRRAIYVLANSSLGDFLSVSLSNKKVREYLKTVTYKDKQSKSKSSLYTYISRAFREFFGFTNKEANVLDTLLSITGDIATIKLNQSDFAESMDARQAVLKATEKQINQELKKPYKTRNRFVVSFTQAKDKPLASVKDLMTKIAQDPVKAAQYLLGEQLSPEQEREIKYFADFSNKFTIYLKSAYAENPQMNKDLKSYLFDPNTGNLDTNLAGALTLAVYDYIKSNGNKNKNTYDDVKKILNLDKDSNAIIPGHIYRQYAYKGNLASFVAADLGKVAVAALGINETENATKDSKSELEMSLGNWALHAMQIAELGSLQFMPQEQHLNNIKTVRGTEPGGLSENGSDYVFFTFKGTEAEPKSTRVEEIIKVSKNTKGIVAKLFNIESGVRYPKLTEPSKVKRKIKKSRSLVSNLQATFMEAMQREPIEADVVTYDVMDTLLNNHNSWFKHLVGAAVTKDELDKMHINDRESAEAAAEGLEREIDNGMSFIGSLKRNKKGFQNFWDSVYTASNNRMHFNSNVFNMQTSIIQRMMASYKNFRTTINMEGINLDNLLDHALDEKGNPTKIGFFLSAVAMNMEDFDSALAADIQNTAGTELKSYTKDKVYSKDFMPAFVKLLQTDKVQSAISAMQKVMNKQKLSKAELNAIEDFVNTAGMKMQSVRALIELTNMVKAMESGSELSTGIGLGSDGINNGIALASVYNGVATVRTLLQTGFIPKNDRNIKTQFDTKLHKDIGDYYEAFAEVFTRNMQDVKESADSFPSVVKAIEVIEAIQPAFDIVANPKAARKLAKAIIIPFGYSAGTDRLVQVAQESFISDIQKKMAKLANDKAINNTSPDYVEFQEQLQVLLDDKKFTLPEEPSALLEFWFTPKQLGALSNTYETIIEKALKNSLEEFAGVFKSSRERNITMHEATFEMFNEVRESIITNATAEMANQLNITLDEMKDRGFTNKEWDTLVEPQIARITPRILNAFATTQGDIENSENIDLIEDSLSSLEVLSRGKKFIGGKVLSKVKGKNVDDLLQMQENTLPAMTRIIKKVGVFINSAQIQGTDGRISAEASAMLGGKVNLNIHDQNDGGLDNYLNMVLTQNKATFKTLATNHLQLNSLETFVETLQIATAMYSEGAISELVYRNVLNKAFFSISRSINPEHTSKTKVWDIDKTEIMDLLTELVHETEKGKIDILTNLQAVQQYAGEMGEYIITDEDVQLAIKELGKISSRMDALIKGIESNDLLMKELAIPAAKPANVTDTVPVPKNAKRIKKSEVESIENPIQWVRDTINDLYNRLDTKNANTQHQLDLMEYLITRLMEVNPNIKIEVVNEKTMAYLGKDNPDAVGAHGLFYNDTIYILDTKLANQGNKAFSTMATITHEMVHAITENQINSNDPKFTDTINQLESLRSNLERIPTSSIAIKNALTNISELVAYGLTHPEVRDFIATYARPTAKGLSNPTKALSWFLEQVSNLFNFVKHPNRDKWTREEVANYRNFVRLVDRLSKPIPPSPTDGNGKSKSTPKASTVTTSHLTDLSVGNSSTTHNSHLDSIIDMIDTFVGNDANRGRTIQDSTKAKTPMSIVTRLGMSDKEASVYEATRAVLSTYIKTQGNNVGIRELQNMAREFNAGQLTKEDFVDDWATATKDERNHATALFNNILGANPSNMKSDVLIKFTALALSSEKFRQILDKPRQRISKYENDDSLFSDAMTMLENGINKMTELYVHTNNKNITGQIDRLFYNLQAIDEKARINKETLDQKVWKGIGVIGNVVNGSTKTVLAKAINLAKGSSNERMRKFGEATNELAKNDATAVGTLILDTVSKYGKLAGKRYGEGRNLVNEIVSTTHVKKVHERIARFTTSLGQLRQQIQDNTREALLDEFTNRGKDLSRVARDSITTVALRSDMASLLEYMNITEVMALLRSPSKREQRIKDLEQQIKAMEDGNDMVMQAKALAAYMIANKGTKHLVKSTQLIATRHGLPSQVELSKMDKATYEAVNTLTSLYATRYGYSKSGFHFDQVIAQEEDGIKAMLKAHKAMIDRSRADFLTNPYNYSKGYLPNISDPHRSLVWVEPNEVAKYLTQGWQKVTDAPLKRDALDTTFDRVLLYHPHMDYQNRVSGGLDLIDTHAKGQIIYAESQDLARVAKARAQERIVRSKTVRAEDYNPFDEDTAMIATYGADGAIQDYHYEMESFLRDDYLQRNNDPFALLSRMDAKTQFKPQIEESQRSVARALYEDYKANYAKNPELFVVLDPDSDDKKVRDDYALTPYAFKVEAHKLFGDGPIVVRASVYNTVFGYKVYSLGNIFNKEYKNMNKFEKLFYVIFSILLGEKAKSRVIATEDVIKMLTKQVKDFIVIRGTKVLIGNILANTMLLMLQGVNPVDIMKGYNYAWQEGQRYRRSQKVVMQLRTKMMYAKANEIPALRRQIMAEEHSMKRSSMHDYMQQGIMSTIVEDVTVLKDQLAYKTGIEQKLDELGDKTPAPIKTAFDWMVVNPGTPMHKFLSDATQFSDFSAKYVLAEHLRKKGMSSDEALSLAQESFINFDLPQGQGMDYMGRMGLFMFTKFFFRFQRVLSKLLWEKPAQTIAQHYISESLFNMQGVLDPLMTNNLGNPFDFGALNLLDGQDTVMTEMAGLVF